MYNWDAFIVLMGVFDIILEIKKVVPYTCYISWSYQEESKYNPLYTSSSSSSSLVPRLALLILVYGWAFLSTLSLSGGQGERFMLVRLISQMGWQQCMGGFKSPWVTKEVETAVCTLRAKKKKKS